LRQTALNLEEIMTKHTSTIASTATVLVIATGAALAHAEVRIGLAAPLTGTLAWAGGETEEGAEIAVADLNAQGGVLGEPIELIKADDYCDAEQAVAAANKLLADKVVMVFGHQCSGAAIPASEVYADADVLMISNFATNPTLTERGLRNVFRVVGRDDLQGEIAAELLAKRWGSEPIAILHDGEAYGKGLAQETKKGLNQRGVTEASFQKITPEQVDYFDVIEQMRADGVTVLYYGGYAPEAALIIRQARSANYDLQLVSGDALGNEDFGLIAGPAADGAVMTHVPNPATNPDATALGERLDRPDTESAYTAYAALQVWAQAVEKAGTFETEAVAEALRHHEFDTVLGTIGFDAKGDVTGYDTFVWYRWQDGDYAPVDPGTLTD
jgi:branched-chain amino acid transport system substrate-binding protein